MSNVSAMDAAVKSWLSAGIPESANIADVPLPLLFSLYPDLEPQGEKWLEIQQLCKSVNSIMLSTSELRFYTVLLHWFQENGIHDDYRDIPPAGTSERFLFSSILRQISFFNSSLDEQGLPARLDMMPWTFLIGSYAYILSEWGITPPHLDGLAEAYQDCLDGYRKVIAAQAKTW